MKPWQRRLIAWAIEAVLVTYMYKQMVRLGWPRHAILIFFACFAVLSGIALFVLKPNKQFAEFLGRGDNADSRRITAIATIVLGAGLLGWALF